MRTLIFDTETTDLIKNTVVPDRLMPHVIEFFGNVLNEDLVVVEELHFLSNPGRKLEKITTDITGLTDEDLKDALPFKANEARVRELLASCDELVAHNLSYDIEMLKVEFRRAGSIDLVKWPKNNICTVEETEWLKGHRLNLSSLHELIMGKPFSGAHRARTDVGALTQCFIELRKRGDI